MKIKERKFLFGIPSWRLSLYTAILSLFILFPLAYLLGSIPIIDENFSEGIAYIIYDIFIATACELSPSKSRINYIIGVIIWIVVKLYFG